MAKNKGGSREIEQFLYREATLLDARRYEEWLALFTEDATYWMPTGKDDIDPKKATSLVYDNQRALAERVARLLHPAAHCQTPPSRTRHLITNVSPEKADKKEVQVYSNFLLLESRLGTQRVFGGHFEHELRREGADWRIQAKKVCLINNDGVLTTT